MASITFCVITSRKRVLGFQTGHGLRTLHAADNSLERQEVLSTPTSHHTATSSNSGTWQTMPHRVFTLGIALSGLATLGCLNFWPSSGNQAGTNLRHFVRQMPGQRKRFNAFRTWTLKSMKSRSASNPTCGCCLLDASLSAS